MPGPSFNFDIDLRKPKSPETLQTEHKAIVAGELSAAREDREKNFENDQTMLDKTASRAMQRRREIWLSDKSLHERLIASDQMFDAAAAALSHKQLVQIIKDSAQLKGGSEQARILAGYHQAMVEFNQSEELAEQQIRGGSMAGMATLRNVLSGVAGDAKGTADLQSLKKFRQANNPASQPVLTQSATTSSSIGASPQAIAYAASKPNEAANDEARKKVMWGDKITSQTTGSYDAKRVGYDDAACYACGGLARVINSNFGKQIVSNIDDPENPGKTLEVPLETMLQGMNGSSTLKFPNGRVMTDAKGISDKAFGALPPDMQLGIRKMSKRALIAASVGQPGMDEKVLAGLISRGTPEDQAKDQEQLALWRAALQGSTADPDIQAVFVNAAENVFNYTGGKVQPHDIARVRVAATKALAEAAGLKETELWDKAVLIKDMMIKDRIGAIQSQVRAGNDPALVIKDFVADTPLGRMTRDEVEKAKPYILQGIVSDPTIDEATKSARVSAFNEAWAANTSGVADSLEPGSIGYQRAFRESPIGQDILADPTKSIMPGEGEPILNVKYPFTMPEDIQPGDISQRYYQIQAKTAFGNSYGAALDPNVVKTYTDAVTAGAAPETALPPDLKPDTSGQDKLVEMAGAQVAAKTYAPFRTLEATEPPNIGEGSAAFNQERRDAAMKQYEAQRKQYDTAAGMSLSGSINPNRQPRVDIAGQPLQPVESGQTQPQATPGVAPTGRGSAPAPAAAPATAPAPGPAAPPGPYNNLLTPTNPWTQAPVPNQQYGFGDSLRG